MKVKVVFGISLLVFLIIGGVVLFKSNAFYDPPDSAGNTEQAGKEIQGSIKLKKNDNYTKLAKVTLLQAYQNFHSKYKDGKVSGIRLGEDAGYLIYDIVFLENNQKKEAKVDAGTGQILAVDKAENNNDSSGGEASDEQKSEKQDTHFTGTIHVKDSQQSRFSMLSKINPAKAAKTVKKQFLGKVTEVNLENENDYLMYSVVIDNDGKTLDVKVDAGTGKVIGKEANNTDEQNVEVAKGQTQDKEKKIN